MTGQMRSLDVITNKNGVNKLITQMKVCFYRHGVNQAQGHLLNVNYYCCVITEQKHSNPPPSPVYHGARYEFACTSEFQV